ncbi:MAG: drug/metabolite transporter (DMT)-like permease [Alphaproteobacteria bacterium]|jgi:drug/metabolite transporter (DMT)-like permease
MNDSAPAGGAIKWLPLLLLLVLGAIWGGNPVFSKSLVTSGVSPAAVVFWQTLGAGVLLSIICIARRTPIRLNRRAIIYYLVIGVIGIDVAYIMLVFSVRHLTVGYVSVLVLFSPLLTYVFAILLRLERVNLLRGLGIVVGFAGAAVLVVPDGSLPSPDLLGVALLSFIVPAGYAMANIFAEWGRPANADNVALAAGTMFAAAGGALVVTLVAGNFHPVWVDFGQRELILFGFSLATAIAFLLFYLIIALAGAVYLGQVGYIVTLAGVGWGALFFGETVSVWLWVAIAIVGVGVGMVNLGKTKTA